MPRLILILFIVLQSALLWGQTEQKPFRVELESNPNAEPYLLIPMGEKGFLIIRKTNEIEERSMRRWGIASYDTRMESQWEIVLTIPSDHEYGSFYLTRDELSLFYFDPRAAESNVLIALINLKSRNFKTIETTTDKRFDPFYFERLEDFCYLGMSSRNSCKLFRIDCKSSETSEMPLDESGGVFIENVQVDSLSQELIVLTSLRNEHRRNGLFMQRFNANGSSVSFQPLIKGENRKMVTSAAHVNLGDGKFMILGSYTDNPQRRTPNASEPEGSKSTGIYRVIAAYGSAEPQVQFYSFSNLANLDDYVRGSSAGRRQGSLGNLFQSSSSNRFEHNLTVHKILKYKELYLLIGEAFSPDYRTVTTVVYDYYGRPVPRSYSVFDGYRYSHAFAVAFGKDGRLMWDNGTELINIRTFDIAEKVAAYMDEDGLALAYNHDGKIAWKQVNENETVTALSYANIETSYSKDRVNSEQSSRFVYWYDNYFLAYGYQTIVNNYLPARNQRTVFYINKIVFE